MGSGSRLALTAQPVSKETVSDMRGSSVRPSFLLLIMTWIDCRPGRNHPPPARTAYIHVYNYGHKEDGDEDGACTSVCNPCAGGQLGSMTGADRA